MAKTKAGQATNFEAAKVAYLSKLAWVLPKIARLEAAIHRQLEVHWTDDHWQRFDCDPGGPRSRAVSATQMLGGFAGLAKILREDIQRGNRAALDLESASDVRGEV